MDGAIVSAVVKYAGLGGLALLVFYYLLRDIVDRKVLVSLSRQDSYRMMRWILLAVWSVVVLALAAHFFSGGVAPARGPAPAPEPVPGPAPKRTPEPASKADSPVPTLYADNVATQVGPQQWQWKVFVVADDATRARIRCVDYTLHESFGDQRFNRVCDPSEGFALSGSGWGVFDVAIRVTFVDGTQQHLTHTLKF